MAIEVLPGRSSSQWVREAVLQAPPLTVARVIPAGFDAYIRLLSHRKLTRPRCGRIAGLLTPFTGQQTCFLEPEPLFHDLEHAVTYRCVLADIPAALLAFMLAQGREWGRFPPPLWWPADRSWCLVTDEMYGETYVGGPRALTEALLADTTLGGVAVAPTDTLQRS